MIGIGIPYADDDTARSPKRGPSLDGPLAGNNNPPIAAPAIQPSCGIPNNEPTAAPATAKPSCAMSAHPTETEGELDLLWPLADVRLLDHLAPRDVRVHEMRIVRPARDNAAMAGIGMVREYQHIAGRGIGNAQRVH